MSTYPQAASSGDNFGTIAYTLDYTWINLIDGEFIWKDFCWYTPAINI